MNNLHAFFPLPISSRGRGSSLEVTTGRGVGVPCNNAPFVTAAPLLLDGHAFSLLHRHVLPAVNVSHNLSLFVPAIIINVRE
jgi:hypothetical protein